MCWGDIRGVRLLSVRLAVDVQAVLYDGWVVPVAGHSKVQEGPVLTISGTSTSMRTSPLTKVPLAPLFCGGHFPSLPLPLSPRGGLRCPLPLLSLLPSPFPWGPAGIEPTTSPTLRENHTTRPRPQNINILAAELGSPTAAIVPCRHPCRMLDVLA